MSLLFVNIVIIMAISFVGSMFSLSNLVGIMSLYIIFIAC